VTLSGGEPTFQPKFALALLKRCREYGIHTAMETCGYTNYDVLKGLVDHLDLLLYDIKHMDDYLHRKSTGVSNKLILANLERLMRENTVECVVRIPLISGFNDNEENVENSSTFLSSLGIKKVDLLPFNELPSGKYKLLGQEWEYKNMKRQPEQVLKKLKKIVEAHGLEVTIGGLW
jgi:pyruvate formate lyase activating enzyme